MRLLVAVFFLALGAFFLSWDKMIERYHFDFYNKNEPYYAAPVALQSHRLFLRNDRYGKGYFGASRNGGRVHQGIDLKSPVGGPVLAAKSGRVAAVAQDKGYGNYIILAHPDGLKSFYAHLLDSNVREGAWVSQNQCMARIGKTGNAANPRILSHLHFEIRQGDKSLNPSDPRLLNPGISVQ